MSISSSFLIDFATVWTHFHNGGGGGGGEGREGKQWFLLTVLLLSGTKFVSNPEDS
jgi:hypothetical protein